MMTIDYQSILESDNVKEDIKQKKAVFIQDFMDALVNTNIRVNDVTSLANRYDEYWNSVADKLKEHHVACCKNIIWDYIKESANTMCCCDSRFKPDIKGGNYNG